MRGFVMLAAMAAALLSGAVNAADEANHGESDQAIQIMILATYHLGNPGQDLANAQIDPVTTPERQAQLQQVADALARFRPTAIALERVTSDPSTMLDQRYAEFTPADLASIPDERLQIGYRLAHQLSLERVYAIDETAAPGEPSYFPFEAVQNWANEHAAGAELEGLISEAQKQASWIESQHRTCTIASVLAEMNRPDSAAGAGGHATFYYALLRYGSAPEQVGAELNGRWYTRNAKIFANLLQVSQPGDRILIIYGAGHAYWLRHFVKTMPGFELVEVSPLLADAGR